MSADISHFSILARPLPQKETSATRSCLAPRRTQSSTSQTALVDLGFRVAHLLLSEQSLTQVDTRGAVLPVLPPLPGTALLNWSLRPCGLHHPCLFGISLSTRPSLQVQHLGPLLQSLPHNSTLLGGSDPRIQGKAWISSLPLNAELSAHLWPCPPRGLERTLRPSFSIITFISFVLLFKSGGVGGFEVVI